MRKICVVGGGRWGKNHIRTLSELDLLGGICDVNEVQLEEYGKAYPGVRTFQHLSEALDSDMDGFTVATPAHTHFALAKTIIESGYPVLVEKPLALSSAEARKIKEIAQKHKQQVMVGHLMLFHPAIVRIKELIGEGKIGRIQYIYSNRINLGTVRTEENILWSFAPHDVSIFQYLIGARPEEVVARGGAFLQPRIHDTTMTMLRYPGNVICHNYVSWLHPFKEHRIVVIGSKGMLRFDDSAQDKSLLFYEKGIDWVNGEPITRDGPTEQLEFGSEQPLAQEMSYFAENLDGTIARAGIDNAIEVLEILEAATQQIENGDTGVTAAEDSGGLADVHESAYVDETARVDAGAKVGANSKIWHFGHVQSGAEIGEKCSLGQNVNVGNNVKIGSGVKIQNNVSVFEGVELEDYVFCGPSMTFTNVLFPRAKYSVGTEKYGKTLVKEGASIGAKAVIVCGNTVGRHAFIGAGAVVTKDVPDYALMVGSPARRIGWVTEGGERIPSDFSGNWQCSISDKQYDVSEDQITQVE